ncbi:MAG TPA: HD domain-containing protein [Candidatus Paceibacterota bacterium]
MATRAHEGQFRRNVARDPYITHPHAVASLVEQSGGNAEEIASAWLHDVVEDTPVSIDEIRHEFGDAIAHIVDGLTDPPHFEGQPIALRKGWQAERVAEKGKSVKRVKLADQLNNIQFVGFDPPTHFSVTDQLDYVEGAHAIAKNCAGVSAMLDTLFKATYQKSVAAIKGRELKNA